MDYIADGFGEALRIIVGLDREFLGIVLVSVLLATISTVIATLLGVTTGIAVSRAEFRGKRAVTTLINTLMSLPTVVVGLLIYSFLSRRGPLGAMGLLYTRTAIVIGQVILAFPIVTGITLSAMSTLDKRITLTATSLGANRSQRFRTLIHEGRFAMLAAVVAGFGRVFGEVGVSMMLGGNIRAYTRTITTAIALETSKGEFALGIALGLVLLTVALVVNMLVGMLRGKR